MADSNRRNLHAEKPALLGPQFASPRPGTMLSAGILLYRLVSGGVRVMLAHPGGPYFANKDEGAWTIPKGLVNPGEALAAAAQREFAEEVGWKPAGELIPIGEVTLPSRKRVMGFAMRTDESEAALLARFAPGTFVMPWPPRSGQLGEFPEIDRVEFFPISDAVSRIHPAQVEFLDRLRDMTMQPGADC
jgi:predicted NUDIX family NTP pyrophosphohydrolase